MKEVVCNYAIARFRPYRETGEFVNVGVVLACPQVNYFGYLFETRKYKRISDFFPELDVDVFKAGLEGLLKELARLAGRGPQNELHQLVLDELARSSVARFRELVRPRETLFHFGEPGVVLAADPRAKLKALFQHFIKRQSARDREYQEVIMRRNLAEFFRKNNLEGRFRTDQPVGDETYRIKLPFVRLEGDAVSKAIKPLHLDKEGPTDIYRHGDAWISTVKRLRRINRLPGQFLFAVKAPNSDAKRITAADEIQQELRRLDTLAVPFADKGQILEFARS
ncbi:MAG: DUF3037 domain-containing protein [Verrucomicrobiales bacterium]|nr:DUF3037 domain-containing protein [Verrucomicrobiales bacterium]